MNMFFVDPRECSLAKAKTFSGQAPIRQLADTITEIQRFKQF